MIRTVVVATCETVGGSSTGFCASRLPASAASLEVANPRMPPNCSSDVATIETLVMET